jgi:hypothetical protein
LLGYLEWKNYPLLLVDHIYKFLFEEIEVLLAALVGSSFDGGSQLMLGPWLGGNFDRSTVTFVVLK